MSWVNGLIGSGRRREATREFAEGNEIGGLVPVQNGDVAAPMALCLSYSW